MGKFQTESLCGEKKIIEIDVGFLNTLLSAKEIF
jgi:hypothetical protein